MRMDVEVIRSQWKRALEFVFDNRSELVRLGDRMGNDYSIAVSEKGIVDRDSDSGALNQRVFDDGLFSQRHGGVFVDSVGNFLKPHGIYPGFYQDLGGGK
jgi:hypothetical protein